MDFSEHESAKSAAQIGPEPPRLAENDLPTSSGRRILIPVLLFAATCVSTYLADDLGLAMDDSAPSGGV